MDKSTEDRKIAILERKGFFKFTLMRMALRAGSWDGEWGIGSMGGNGEW